MRRGRIALYIAVGCLAYAVTLVATLPAPWLAQALGRHSNQLLLLRAPEGSAWTGSGRLYLRQRSGELLDLGMLRWDTSFAATLIGKFATDVSLGEAARSAHLELSRGSTVLRGVGLELPGSVLAVIAPGMAPLGPLGTLRLRSENLRIDEGAVLGLADIEWRSVRLAVARGLELGSHAAQLRGGGDKVEIDFRTLEGPLRVSGGGSWTRNAGLEVSGTAQHDAEAGGPLALFLEGACSEYREARCVFRYKQ
jgi:general secretion pathway protein N